MRGNFASDSVVFAIFGIRNGVAAPRRREPSSSSHAAAAILAPVNRKSFHPISVLFLRRHCQSWELLLTATYMTMGAEMYFLGIRIYILGALKWDFNLDYMHYSSPKIRVSGLTGKCIGTERLPWGSIRGWERKSRKVGSLTVFFLGSLRP